MNTLKYAIVDDDILAHSVILTLMEVHESYECIGKYFNVIHAIESIKNDKPDIIFLDIDMPDLNGFELLKYIDRSIKVIVTTAHRKYAVEGFDNDILDFLTKPIRQERLFKALLKARTLIESELKFKIVDHQIPSVKKELSYIYACRHREKNACRIEKSDIQYITKANNQIEIYTVTDGPFYKPDTLRGVMEVLPENEFLFVNQSYIVNVLKTECVDGENIYINEHKSIKISPAFVEKFRKI